jgi:hypothetical protein
MPRLCPWADEGTYLVLENFGRLGCVWRETDTESAERETLIRHLIRGEYNNPVRIVAFNIAEGWCRGIGLGRVLLLKREARTDLVRVPEFYLLSARHRLLLSARHRMGRPKPAATIHKRQIMPSTSHTFGGRRPLGD